VAPQDAALAALLRHRAVLLTMISVLCLWAAFAPGPRRAGLLAATISIAAFLVIYALYGAPAGPLRTIALVDTLAIAPVAAAWGRPSRGDCGVRVFRSASRAASRSAAFTGSPRWNATRPSRTVSKPNRRRPFGSRQSRIATSPASRPTSGMQTMVAAAKSRANMARIASRPASGSHTT